MEHDAEEATIGSGDSEGVDVPPQLLFIHQVCCARVGTGLTLRELDSLNAALITVKTGPTRSERTALASAARRRSREHRRIRLQHFQDNQRVSSSVSGERPGVPQIDK